MTQSKIRQRRQRRADEEAAHQRITRWYGKRNVADRYACSMRTIERWVKLGRFPKPVRMANGRDYWADTTLEEHERSLVTDAA